MKGTRRLPAEWEPVEAVVVAWPDISMDWDYIIDAVTDCYIELVRKLSARTHVVIVCQDPEATASRLPMVNSDRLTILPVSLNDTWVRDYGAITVVEDGETLPLDFQFNAWGLKFAANFDNCVTRSMAGYGIFRREPENNLDFVLEGGSIESDGKGTILTTSQCLSSPNRNANLTREQIEEQIMKRLGAERVLWLDHGALTGDDTDSHVDTLARLLPPGDIIAYTGCADPEDEHYQELKAMREELAKFRTSEGRPYHLVELPLPDFIGGVTDGHRLPATYANFLIVNDAVFLPVYGQALKDKLATDILAAALPEREIIPVDCRALVQQHGSLHCATMQLPKLTLSI